MHSRFMLLPADSLGITLLVTIIVILGTLLIAAATMLVAYLTPHYKRMERGDSRERFKLDYKPCCPPGLGCNEIGRRSPCRRLLAYRFADPSETVQLDLYWSTYMGGPSTQTLRAWQTARDTIIEEKLPKVQKHQQKQLLGATETIDIVKGDVCD